MQPNVKRQFSLTLASPCAKSNLERTQKLLASESEKIKFLNPKTLASQVFDDSSRNPTSQKYTHALNNWYLFELDTQIDTDFVLSIHTDGVILNPSAWTEEFFNYDYIGAPWGDKVVGNGGFSLRSKKLLQYVHLHFRKEYEKQPFGIPRNEDYFICRTMRKKLESAGFKFAPYELADKFSVEHGEYKGQFGAHHEIKMNGMKFNLKSLGKNGIDELFAKTSSSFKRIQ